MITDTFSARAIILTICLAAIGSLGATFALLAVGKAVPDLVVGTDSALVGALLTLATVRGQGSTTSTTIERSPTPADGDTMPVIEVKPAATGGVGVPLRGAAEAGLSALELIAIVAGCLAILALAHYLGWVR